MNKNLITSMLCCSLLLAGCGGSGGDTTPVNQDSGKNGNNGNTDSNNGNTDSNNDNTDSGTDTTTKPVAKIQASAFGETGNVIQLSTTGSAIPENAEITWQWQAKPQGSNAQFSNPNAKQTYFTADVAGIYILGLTIKSGSNESTTQFEIRIKEKTTPSVNTPPVADFTLTKQEIAINEHLQLDASNSSDSDGDNLSYKWQVTAPANVDEYTLVSPNNNLASFASKFAGEYTITLTVYDGKSSHSKSEKVIVIDNQPALKAVISAPSEVTLSSMTFVELKSDGSQYQGAVTPLWSFDSKPSGSQAAMATPNGFLTSLQLDKAGQYKIRFSLKDKQGRLSEATHTLTAKLGEANKPLVFVDAPESTKINEAIELSAKRSRDTSGRTLSFSWTFKPFEAGLTYSVTNEDTDTVIFTPHGEGTYRYFVEVSNGELSQTASGVIKSHPENYGPTASMSPQISTAAEGETKVFVVSAEDKDGDPLTYRWSLETKPENSTAVVNNADNRASITFDEAGNYVLKCIVSDGKVELVVAAFIKVSAVQNSAPVITALDYQGVLKTDAALWITPTVIDSDSNAGNLTYFWKVVAPSGEVIDSTAAHDSNLQFTPVASGDYQVSLSVVDEKSASVATKTITLSVE
ncbi:PKD domain-containing protein [Pseudoalteromonas sp. HM-SA03]|uniref:PKD domain-containing protein n=1 Tax=Pseudoalteromonas sp. HM-SA03 TaxID=2029678 RepID=UPI000BAE3CCC|nr:PKD domain-containing protein [Pseudoalteromonas sp. HM-SA03]PAX99833.1 PKD domain-containing protein [Pseudoalteromonas sp. HM-SA03]